MNPSRVLCNATQAERRRSPHQSHKERVARKVVRVAAAVGPPARGQDGVTSYDLRLELPVGDCPVNRIIKALLDGHCFCIR